MKIAMFYHSLVSDWNHGNAHFLRGIASDLLSRGHDVQIFEPENGWSRRNLIAEHGDQPLEDFKRIYPTLDSTSYDPESLDLDHALEGADVVIVHEWNPRAFIKRLSDH